MSLDKQQIRNQISQTIAKLLPTERESLSKKACENLIEFLISRHCKNVLFFSSMADEIDLNPLLKDPKNFKVYLPKIEKSTKQITVHAINKFTTDTQIGSFGIIEPITPAINDIVGQLDCIIVPARAIDFEGNRIGRGLGYYDRFLSQVKSSHLLIACMVYHLQIVGEVPKDELDVPIEFCISEKGVFHLRRRV